MNELESLVDTLKAGDEAAARKALGELSVLRYEMLRKPLADEAGIRPNILDTLRAGPRADSSKQGTALTLDTPEPAREPQAGAILLTDIAFQIRRFLIADETSIAGMSLWVAWSYIVDSVPVAPLLAFTSPLRACGKSTALDIVSKLATRALSVSGISPAALFRTIESMKPTLLIDEADSLFRDNDELRTLINAGFTRSAANVIRITGDELEPRLYSTWGAKALALIGKLPDTLASRSVIIPMRRKRPDETTERLRSDIDQGFAELRARLARWTLDTCEAIVARDPEVPASLSDRQADCWRELLRIADTAGGVWPARARRAAVAICGRADDDEGDMGTRLLVDLKSLFDTEPERIAWPSSKITEYLNALELSPWPDYAHGKGMDANRMARILTRFDVRSKNVVSGMQRLKGYTVAMFSDAFARYLPASRTSATESDNSILDNENESSGKVAGTDARRYHDETMKKSSGAEPLPLPKPLPNISIHRNELQNKVAAARVDEGSRLELLDGLFGRGTA